MKRKIAFLLSIVMCLSMFVGNGLNLKSVSAAVLNKDTWTQDTDGKWKKIVDIQGWDFENVNNADDIKTTRNEALPNVDPSQGVTNKFWNDGNGTSNVDKGTFSIVSISDANKGLKFSSPTGPNNVTFKAPFDKSVVSDFELKYNIKIDNISGWNAIKLEIGKINGNIINTATTFSSTGTYSGTMPFKSTDVTIADIIRVKFNAGANVDFTIDSLELIMVSDTNPEAGTDKEELIKNNDILKPKNGGDFTSDPFTTSPTSFTKNNNVTIADEDYKMPTGKSAKINANGKVEVFVENLKNNTEYTIFFYAKTTDNLNFIISGFNQEGIYGNGDHEVAQMFNWIENNNIRTSNTWKPFRYDFTTSNTSSKAKAEFSVGTGTANIDAVYIVERAKLQEITYELPDNTKLSNGHRLLIKNGLQFMSWVTTDKDNMTSAQQRWMFVPPLETIKDMGLTATQYNDKPNFNKDLHQEAGKGGLNWATAWGPKYSHVSSSLQDSSDGKTGQPTEEEWKNGFLTTTNGLDYVDDLVSMTMGDEEDYSDTLTQNVKSWMEVAREKIEKSSGKQEVILHHNDVGNGPNTEFAPEIGKISTFNISMLRKFVRNAKPDMITQDMYYFRERRVTQTEGGTVTGLYDDLNRYRIVAREGIDGTGEQPIPFGQYHYSWRTGPGGGTETTKRGDGWYELTESQINLYSFATYAFGGKWMSNFRWLHDNPMYLFSDYRVDANGKVNKYDTFYDQFKEMIRQSQNLGPHLVRIVNDGVTMVSGQHKTANGNIEINKEIMYNPRFDNMKNNIATELNPQQYVNETKALNERVFIDSVNVRNDGTQNDGLAGDIFISYFNVLPNLPEENKDVFTSTDPRYFTLLNGMTSGDGLPAEMQQGSAYETRQTVTVNFNITDENRGKKLKKVSRVTNQGKGLVVDVPISEVNGKYQMVATIGGGYADLYYWELGNTKSSITGTATDENSKEDLIIGQQKYANNIEKRKDELNGKTFVIGHIAGTDNIAPENNMAKNINTPAPNDLYDGSTIELLNYATAAGNIGAIGTRYYGEDMWGFRTEHIEKDNGVNLDIKDVAYDWTKEQLIENINKVKAGEIVTDMPDIMVVPNDWLWDINGLIANDSVLALNDADAVGNRNVIEFTKDTRRWNEAFTNMATKDGKTYASRTNVSQDPIGMFVNKNKLDSLNLSTISSRTASVSDSVYFRQGNASAFSAGTITSTVINDLLKDDKWTFAELDTIINSAVSNDIASQGVKLFGNNDYLLRQLLISSGVTDPYKFDANSAEYKTAMDIYNRLKAANLLMEGTLDEQMKAFQEGSLLFIVAPYTEVAKHLSADYWYYEDNTHKEKVDNYNGKWGPQTYRAAIDKLANGNNNWKVTVRKRPAGQYTLPIDDWNFILFPKPTVTDNYRAILNNPSIPVVLSSTANAGDTAFIFSQLQQEYKGLDVTWDLFNRGGENYPDGRFWEAVGREGSKDVNAIRKAGLRDGFGDLFKATGVWDNVLSKAIKDGSDATTINSDVIKYLNSTPLPEDEAKLNSLKLSNITLSPVFNSDTLLYAGNTIKAISELAVVSDKLDANIEVFVNDKIATSGKGKVQVMIPFASIKTKIDIKVTLGEKSKTYSIEITKNDTGLTSDWTIVNEDPSGWSCPDDKSDAVVIKASNGNLTGSNNNAKNIFTTEKNLNRNTFTVTANIKGKALLSNDEAGLIIYSDNDNYVLMNRKNNGNSEKTGLVTESNGITNNSYENDLNVADSVYFKMEKNDISIKGSYSENGKDWTSLGTVTNNTLGDNFKVGVFAFGGLASDTSFRFEDFTIDNIKIPFVGNSETIDPETIMSLVDVNIETEIGKIPVLPQKVTANLYNETKKEVSVVWDNITQDMVSKIGEFFITGKVAGTEIVAKAIVTVKTNLDIDKTKLNELIQIAKSKLYGNYTYSSLEVLRQMIANAETIILKENATQQEINDAYNNLKIAINNLVVVDNSNNNNNNNSNTGNSNNDDYNYSDSSSSTSDTPSTSTTTKPKEEVKLPITSQVVKNEEVKNDTKTETVISMPGLVKDKTISLNITNDIMNKLIEESRNIIEKAIKSGTDSSILNSIIEFNIELPKGTKGNDITQLKIELPKIGIENVVKEGNTSIKIKSLIGEMIFDNKALNSIVQKSKGDMIVISAEILDNKSLSDEVRQNIEEQIGDRTIYDFSVSSLNNKISSFDSGSVTVRIPYELKAGENSSKTISYYIDDTGNTTVIKNCNYNEKESMFVFVTKHFSKYAIGYKNVNFSDISSHWANRSIEFTVARALFSGTSENMFSPDNSVTRGMFVTLLGRLEGIDVNQVNSKAFNDVKSNAYYAPYIAWANDNGIVSGVSDTEFAPERAISREEMAVMLYNASKVMTTSKLLEKIDVQEFTDENSISSWALDAVKSIQKSGIINGKNNNMFDPKGTATRAEAATIFQQFIVGSL